MRCQSSAIASANSSVPHQLRLRSCLCSGASWHSGIDSQLLHRSGHAEGKVPQERYHWHHTVHSRSGDCGSVWEVSKPLSEYGCWQTSGLAEYALSCRQAKSWTLYRSWHSSYMRPLLLDSLCRPRITLDTAFWLRFACSILAVLSGTKAGDNYLAIDIFVVALSGGFTVLATKAFSSFLTRSLFDWSV